MSKIIQIATSLDAKTYLDHEGDQDEKVTHLFMLTDDGNILKGSWDADLRSWLIGPITNLGGDDFDEETPSYVKRSGWNDIL